MSQAGGPNNARLGGGYIEIEARGTERTEQQIKQTTETVKQQVTEAATTTQRQTGRVSGSLNNLNKSFDDTAGKVFALVGKFTLLFGAFTTFLRLGQQVRALTIDIGAAARESLQVVLDRINSTDTSGRLNEINTELLRVRESLAQIDRENTGATPFFDSLMRDIRGEGREALELQEEILERQREAALLARNGQLQALRDQNAELARKLTLTNQLIDADEKRLRIALAILQASKDEAEQKRRQRITDADEDAKAAAQQAGIIADRVAESIRESFEELVPQLNNIISDVSLIQSRLAQQAGWRR